MKIYETNLEYYIDYLNRGIHLLDTNNSLHNSLPNAISPAFQKELVEKEHLLMDVLEFEWLLYCRNGVVMRFKNYNLSFIPETEKRLYEPFLTVIRDT